MEFNPIFGNEMVYTKKNIGSLIKFLLQLSVFHFIRDLYFMNLPFNFHSMALLRKVFLWKMNP